MSIVDDLKKENRTLEVKCQNLQTIIKNLKLRVNQLEQEVKCKNEKIVLLERRQCKNRFVCENFKGLIMTPNT